MTHIIKDVIHLEYNTRMSRLLCTFTPKSDMPIAVNRIKTTYTDVDKIFILKLDKTQEYACTYTTNSLSNMLVSTIKINRHSDTNTIYTVNALNMLTNGTRSRIEWDLYINKAILISKGNLLIHKITLHDIIKIDT